MKNLILGGARSGKSRLAETRARATGKKRIYIATGQAGDKEMADRIAQHKLSRGSEWHTIEEPIHLAAAISAADGGNDDCVIVVDCLTLWLSNCLVNSVLEQEKQALIDSITHLKNDIFLVSNEVGSGVVPLGQLSREFVDNSGWLHQKLATLCNQVTLVVAGLPLELKNSN